MIRPPRGVWRFISRKACCVQRNAPVRFVSTTDTPVVEVEVLERDGRGADAGVVEEHVESAEPVVDLGEERRDRRGIADVARDRHRSSWPASAAAASRASRRRPVRTTVKPASASAIADARPMPLPAPVTRATGVTFGARSIRRARLRRRRGRSRRSSPPRGSRARGHARASKRPGQVCDDPHHPSRPARAG